jgi:hypothetical protein
MKKSQCQFILDHLIDHGYITEIVARSYGVRRLASRIDELKGVGVSVVSTIRRDDVGTRYAHYTLSESARDFEREERADGCNWKGGYTRRAA